MKYAMIAVLLLVGCGNPKFRVGEPIKVEGESGCIITEVKGSNVVCRCATVALPSQPPAAARPSEEQENTTVIEYDSRLRPDEAAVYVELRKQCKAKKLKYMVYCFAQIGCNAEAWDNRLTHYGALHESTYLAHDEDPTDAAYKLLKLLEGAPNRDPGEYKPPPQTFSTGEVRP